MVRKVSAARARGLKSMVESPKDSVAADVSDSGRSCLNTYEFTQMSHVKKKAQAAAI